MSNHPPLCVPYFRDDHVLAFDVREQKSKRDEGINLQVSSRESLEEGKKGTAIKLVRPLCLFYENPPPALAHICHSLLRRHNIFSLRRNMGARPRSDL